MDASSRAPFYDLFKLIIALILLLIFLFLLSGMPPSGAPWPSALATFTSQPSLPSLVPSSISIPMTEISTATTSSTPAPIETQSPTPAPTIIPSPTAFPVPEATLTPDAATAEETHTCETVSRSQLQIGTHAIILRRLNFRSSPGISNNWLLTNIPGTPVEVISGPECTRYEGGGTYLWWQIRLPSGQEGWSAEASASGTFYFMEPMP